MYLEFVLDFGKIVTTIHTRIGVPGASSYPGLNPLIILTIMNIFMRSRDEALASGLDYRNSPALIHSSMPSEGALQHIVHITEEI